MSPVDGVDIIAPEGIADPARASGGNVFDARLAEGLAALGWSVRMHEVDPDAAPRADRALDRSLAGALAAVPDRSLVLVDGLIAARAPDAMVADADRLRIAVLAHMVCAAFPGVDSVMVVGERRALRAARLVVATSAWTGEELIRRGLVPADRVIVAPPGSDDAPRATGSTAGGALLCVGVVASHKGQDTLIEALAELPPDAHWTCTIAGSLATHPDFAAQIAARTAAAGLTGRVTLTGVLERRELDEAYRRADLLVAPSRSESYGMAIADALRRGIPVVASRVGGIPQTVASGGAVLVPPGEPRALRDVLQRWIADPALRARLRDGAQRGGARIPRWSDTAAHVAQALSGVR